MSTKYRVKVSAIHNDEDRGVSKFVPLGMYDVAADGFDAAAQAGVDAARRNPTYADETAGDTELHVVSITDLTKPKDL